MKRILSALLALAATGAIGSVCAQSPLQEHSLEIVRQPLKAALTELSKQTGLDIAYVQRNRKQADTMAGPLNGRYTVEAALNELLAHSCLVFMRVNDRTFAVTTRKAAKCERSAHRSEKSKQSAPKLLYFVRQNEDAEFLGLKS